MTAGKPATRRSRKQRPEPEQLVLFKKRGGKRRVEAGADIFLDKPMRLR